ncbi:hypothetical protein LTR09_010440 [Extremus antarcticus]|uniref:Uncharacterized protein n=1 Tax=Extremus antarcticus TaxID=702011 RepID=A0AAJ0G546_9PEZI|nr:hypothetical protein LTR09_010440 [Extremus antarcticus]
MDGIANLHSWQWFVLLEGMVSIMVAVIGFWLLPNWPDNTGTYYFSAEESEMAQYRAEVSTGGRSEDDEGGYLEGLTMACKDPFTWMFAGQHFALILMQSYKDFLPSRKIMDTFGFTEVETYLIQAPPWFVAYIITLVVSWHSGRKLEHCWHIVACILVSTVGAVILISTVNTGARYFSIFLLCAGPFVGLNIQLSWETIVVPRPRTKRAALIAIANSVSSITHWFSPYFFLRSQEPRYELGGGIIIVGAGLTIISCFVTKGWATKKNKELVREEEITGITNSWRYVT